MECVCYNAFPLPSLHPPDPPELPPDQPGLASVRQQYVDKMGGISALSSHRLAVRVSDNCGSPIATGTPVIYKLPIEELIKDGKLMIAKYRVVTEYPASWREKLGQAAYSIGHGNIWHGAQAELSCSSCKAAQRGFASMLERTSPPGTDKVLMVVGATGAGKTTLINGMANYLMGVDWDDDFRFKLITEAKTQSDARSQETWITTYTFPKTEGSRFPLSFTIIDTPGFGDTEGFARDKQIARQIKEFFSLPMLDGIDHIDALGFVTQACLARLSVSQKYIFESVLAIFGKDIADNIMMMTTFADSGKPCVLDSVREARIPFKQSFKFNNSALFEKSDSMFDNLFWEMGVSSFKDFFKCFQGVTPKSLQLTREVLHEREHLEAVSQNLHEKVNTAMEKFSALKQEEHILKQHEADIAANKNFKYTVQQPRMDRIKLDSGVHVLNCFNCHLTCHFPCSIEKEKDKSSCSVMSSGRCTVCPRKCHWSDHVSNEYRITMEMVTVERTYENLKKRYDEAKRGKSAKENVMRKMKAELDELKEAVGKKIEEAQRSLCRLKEIALKPDPLSEVEYIDLLIQSEKQEAKAGWIQHVECLQDVRKQSLLLQDKNLGKSEDVGWWEKLLRHSN